MILMSFHNVLSKVRKIEKIKTFDLNYFFDKFFFDDDGFQNMFIYQLPLNMLEIKEDKDTELSVYWNTQHSNVIEWKSKGAYTSELTASYTAYLHNSDKSKYMHSGYGIGFGGWDS